MGVQLVDLERKEELILAKQVRRDTAVMLSRKNFKEKSPFFQLESLLGSPQQMKMAGGGLPRGGPSLPDIQHAINKASSPIGLRYWQQCRPAASEVPAECCRVLSAVDQVYSNTQALHPPQEHPAHQVCSNTQALHPPQEHPAHQVYSNTQALNPPQEHLAPAIVLETRGRPYRRTGREEQQSPQRISRSTVQARKSDQQPRLQPTQQINQHPSKYIRQPLQEPLDHPLTRKILEQPIWQNIQPPSKPNQQTTKQHQQQPTQHLKTYPTQKLNNQPTQHLPKQNTNKFDNQLAHQPTQQVIHHQPTQQVMHQPNHPWLKSSPAEKKIQVRARSSSLPPWMCREQSRQTRSRTPWVREGRVMA